MTNEPRDPARDPVVVLGRRTAFARKNGALRGVTADALLAPVLAAVVADSGLDARSIDDVIIGNAVGGGGNVARLAALLAGLPVTVPAQTIDRQCGSGLEAIVLACRLVAAGAGTAYLAGGVDSTSTAPLRANRLTSTPGAPDFFDRVRFAPDSIGDPDMGVAADTVASRFAVSRARQDAFALRSHERATRATDAGAFADEIVPVVTPAGLVREDQGPRRTLSPALLARFGPAFSAGGSVTAGNACADADGAVVVLVTNRATAEIRGWHGVLGFVDALSQGTDPNVLGIAGGEAARALLRRQGLSADALERVEFTEAFASQVLASLDLIGVPEERANRQGGALAFGHPYGASGALLVLRLLQQARADATPGELSLAALSIAGGLGTAALWEWISG
ncbi:acetyl-CoA acetyltransferase [Cryobacterium roopkundense]|uniref:Acetyl-CoA acetyltransferase n=1 Tax=Cryobacterium roopkundense TaxID=1001240 RepID=A0A099JFD0_9MICO|nr:thiolase family protein [Cryobacterium roopkundense]KGJ77139.1 acetyl-CoA acetyltransferase [Cryobacterium roopkundense]